MSTYEAQSALACPRCGERFNAPTADTINVTRMPGARADILEGRFHRVTCPACQRPFRVERVFLYTDLRRKHFAQVFPPVDWRRWPELEEEAAEVFWRGFEGPPGVKQMAAAYRVRAVFG